MISQWLSAVWVFQGEGHWWEQLNSPFLQCSDDSVGFFPDWTEAPYCPGGIVCPAFQWRCPSFLPHEQSAGVTTHHCPRDSAGKLSSLRVCDPQKTSRTKAMILQSPGVFSTWHEPELKFFPPGQHWIIKWPPDYREVECCFCLHKTDWFKFINYIKNPEKVNYLSGQNLFPRLSLFSLYNRKGLYLRDHLCFSGLKGASVTGLIPSYFGSESSRHERGLSQLLLNTTQAWKRRLLYKIMCILRFFFSL